MIIGILNQTSEFETRTVATPQTVSRLKKLGFDIFIESDSGLSAGFDNDDYQNAGAAIHKNSTEIISKSDILLCLSAPRLPDLKKLKPQTTLIGNFQDLTDTSALSDLQKKHITCFALEKLPRLSRAQPFDILSSQSNLAGYRSVIEAVELSKQAAPMMITSAGTLPPLKFLIIGAGVAGLQAVATAKRLGGKVYASDPREETKDQIKSLGATPVEDIKTILMQCDIIITSAFSAGKKAPVIITEPMLGQLPKGAVLIDMAAQYGGNIEGAKNFEIIRSGNKIIYGDSNLAAKIPYSASLLLANNFYNFINYIYSPENKTISPDFNDPLISGIVLTKG